MPGPAFQRSTTPRTPATSGRARWIALATLQKLSSTDSSSPGAKVSDTLRSSHSQQPGHLARGGEGGVRAAGAAALEDGADEALERRVDGLGPARVAGGADHLGQLPRVRGAAVEALADGAVQDLVDGDVGGAAAQVGHQGDGLVGDEAEVTVARLHPPDARHLGLQAEDEPVVVCGGHEAGVEGGGADDSLRATRPPRRAGARSRIHV